MLTFVYTTCRKVPKFEWFLDSLYNQVVEEKFDASKIEIIVVDFELQYDESRRDAIKEIVKDRFKFKHVEPMPSPWQGKYRLPSRDCFSASLARNTGVCYATNDYIYFIDDLCVLQPGSFKHMIEYASQKIVVAFGYKKVWDLEVENGVIIHKREEPSGLDSRWNQGADFRRIGGSQLFGYSGSPLSVFLSVNGYDEICNSIAGEDYHYAMRVEKLSVPIYYSKKVVFYESENLADQGNVFLRRDPVMSEEMYKNSMVKYQIPARWVPSAKYDVSHLILDMLIRNKSWTEGNNYNLTDLRKHIQSGGKFSTSFDSDIKTLDGVYIRDL
jgi:glycosyltransferase involved in cell wall biosynthesis